MRQLFFSALTFLCCACASGNPETSDIQETLDTLDTLDTPADTSVAVVTAFAKGADISWVTEMEAKGYTFYNAAGEERECTALMKELGFNAVRYRVWVNPKEGYSSARDVLVKAQRAQALGMDIMIDFHYSDSWADPGKQTIPAAWAGYDLTQMTEAVARHTRETLQLLKDSGIAVKWVQVGNEVNTGMLWEVGRVSNGNKGADFIRLLGAGYDAVKSVYPEALVILHHSNGHKYDENQWFYDLMKQGGAKYDVIGLSLYPSYWENGGYPDWKPATQAFVKNLTLLHERYDRPIILVEVGMPAAQPETAKEMLSYVFGNTSGLDFFGGIFYWEPESERSRTGYDYGAFSGGKPTAALDVLK